MISSTRRYCIIDNDSFFLDAFSLSRNYIKDSAGGFVLLDNNGDDVLRAHKKNPPVPNFPKDITGKYSIIIPGTPLIDTITL